LNPQTPALGMPLVENEIFDADSQNLADPVVSFRKKIFKQSLYSQNTHTHKRTHTHTHTHIYIYICAIKDNKHYWKETNLSAH